MNFYHDVISHLLKNAFEGHTKFSVADSTAVGDNPVRSISLDAVPSNENTIISLSWEGGEKLFEKTLSEQEASHQFDLISTDLAEVAALTKQGNYEGAKDLMKKLGQKYAENTGDIVDTNLPKLHNTQAAIGKQADPEIAFERAIDRLDSKLMKGLIHQEEYDAEYAKLKKEMFPKEASQDDKLWRTAKITMQNLWFSTTDELLEYQEKQKGAKSTQDHIPLWDKNKQEKAPKDTLSAPSMSYEDVENEKERDHEDMTKHIDETIKNKLESAMQEKAASVFGPADIELVKSLRAPGIGRNWDEIKKIFIKDLNRDKDATTIFLDEQRSALDPTGIEVEPVKEEPTEKSPLTPPEDLVSPETHDKLLQDHEDKKKDESPLKEIEKVEEPPIKEESSKEDDKYTRICPSCKSLVLPEEMAGPKHCDLCEKHSTFTPQDVMAISELEEIARADNDEIHKVALQLWQRSSNYMGDDLSEYYIGPAIGYEKEPLEVSNFNVALEMLGGEGNGVLVGSFGGFGGGYEQIFVHKDAKDKVAILQDIESKMSKYPVLDESDYSERQMEAERESYESWAKSDALKILDQELYRQNPALEGSVSDLELTPDIEHLLASVVFDDLSYGDGSALNPKHLIQEAEEAGLLNSLRNKLEGKDVVPEDPRQQKLFESKLKKKFIKNALQKKAAPSDLNPLQEPLTEKPTTPSQDVVPMGGKPTDHNAPQKGDRVFVSSDLTGEKAGFEGTFISTYKSQGRDFSIIETDDGDLLDIESNRVVKTSEGAGAQDTEPVMEPIIEQQQPENDVQITPKMDDFHTSSQEDLLAIKAETDDLLGKMGQLEKEAAETFRSPVAVDDLYLGKFLGHEEISFMKEAVIQWNFELEMREWGVKSVYVSVPDQAINLDYEFFRNESAEGAMDDGYEKESKQVQLKDVQVKGLDRTGFDSLAPQTLEYTSDGRWVLDFETSSHYTSCKYPRLTRTAEGQPLPPEHICEQCKKPMGYQGFINPVCDKCVRKNHKQVAGSDFEKGISQNKTSDKEQVCYNCQSNPKADCKECGGTGWINKTAADPVEAPKTQFKDYKITPKYTPKEQAVPATPEMDEVLTKMDSLQSNLATLEAARKQIQAKMKEELTKIDDQGERAQMEAALQESIEKAAVLISAMDNKVIQWKDRLYTLQTEEISYVPSLTPKEMLSKIYAKFSGAEKYVQDVLNGMLSQGKNVLEKTLIRWPNKKSGLSAEADSSPLDMMNHYNEELLAALKELSSPL